MFRTSTLLSLLPVLFVLAVMAGCREGDMPCRRPPQGEVTAFVEGESGSIEFTGTVEGIERPDEAGRWTYRIRDAGQELKILRFGAPADSIPVQVGASYGFRVTTVPGMPTPCAVLVTEDDRFLFAGASDYGPGERVFQTAPAGFEIVLERADCEDRDVNRCFELEVNGQLVVSRGEDSARLYHGESDLVDGVRVTCLTARFIEYSDRCADAGAFGVSYTMRREDAPE